MIFSAIVGTPCIAIDNISHKVKNCYDWLKHLDYIKYCEDVNNLESVFESTVKILDNSFTYNQESNKKSFNEIKRIVCDKLFN